MHEKRWGILSRIEFDDPADDVLVLRVRTPKGTGRVAHGCALVSVEAAESRQVLAWAVRKARTAASNFRAKHSA
jgi:hypothetical protein